MKPPPPDSAARRRLPSVDVLLRDPRVETALARHGRELVADEVRAVLERHRRLLRAPGPPCPAPEALLREALDALEAAARPALRRVFNLTGTVLHTNLGRAPLPPEAAEAAMRAETAACNLEYDLGRGERGERDTLVESLLCRLTGAQAATVVNNNAAAVLLVLDAVARGREVLVSRGELVEIGGSFRIPEILESAGCRLREVGTTNRTHLRDFERAIGPDAAAILKVHASNYEVVGFTAAPAEDALARLAHAHGLPFVVDLGSGSLADLSRWGLPPEPTPREALAAGADVVTFSGDKLLGGPQAGMAVGSRDAIGRMRRDPLKRALRLDKGRLAALESVLRLYLDPDRLAARLPTLRLLTRTREDIRAAAARLRPCVAAFVGAFGPVDVADCASQVGSGSLPVDLLPSAALRVTPAGRKGAGTRLVALAAQLRGLPVPVIGRIHDGALWLDLRCLEDEAAFVAQIRARRAEVCA